MLIKSQQNDRKKGEKHGPPCNEIHRMLKGEKRVLFREQMQSCRRNGGKTEDKKDVWGNQSDQDQEPKCEKWRMH